MAVNQVPFDFLQENYLNSSDAPEKIILNLSFAEEIVKSFQSKMMSSPEEISGLSRPSIKTDNSGTMADHINVICSTNLQTDSSISIKDMKGLVTWHLTSLIIKDFSIKVSFKVLTKLAETTYHFINPELQLTTYTTAWTKEKDHHTSTSLKIFTEINEKTFLWWIERFDLYLIMFFYQFIKSSNLYKKSNF